MLSVIRYIDVNNECYDLYFYTAWKHYWIYGEWSFNKQCRPFFETSFFKWYALKMIIGMCKLVGWIKMAFDSVYHHFNFHPSFIQATQHVVLGFTSFTMLFFLHQLWIGTLISKFHHKGVFLRSRVMEIAVLVNSSIFAIIICFVALIGNGIYNKHRIRMRVHFLHSGIGEVNW